MREYSGLHHARNTYDSYYYITIHRHNVCNQIDKVGASRSIFADQRSYDRGILRFEGSNIWKIRNRPSPSSVEPSKAHKLWMVFLAKFQIWRTEGIFQGVRAPEEPRFSQVHLEVWRQVQGYPSTETPSCRDMKFQSTTYTAWGSKICNLEPREFQDVVEPENPYRKLLGTINNDDETAIAAAVSETRTFEDANVQGHEDPRSRGYRVCVPLRWILLTIVFP